MWLGKPRQIRPRFLPLFMDSHVCNIFYLKRCFLAFKIPFELSGPEGIFPRLLLQQFPDFAYFDRGFEIREMLNLESSYFKDHNKLKFAIK